MESKSNFELVGGITRAVVHLATTPLPEIGSSDGDGVEISLDLGGNYYTERVDLSEGVYRVVHTLCFSSLPSESPFEATTMSQALAEGIVVDITFASGSTIRVGWSDRYGVEFPLRLESVEFSSGEEVTTYPLHKWTWSSVDKSPKMLSIM